MNPAIYTLLVTSFIGGAFSLRKSLEKGKEVATV
jgi:hypothetical protein